MYPISSILLAFLYFVQLSPAQEKEYLDKNHSLTTPEKAVYYRLCKRDDMQRMQGKVTIFRIEGSLYSEVHYIDGLRDGYYAAYHLHGDLAVKGLYEDDHRTGTWEYWYDNHKKQREETYLHGKVKIEHFWDKDGKKLLENGTGFCETHDDIHAVTEKGKFKDYQKEGAWVGYFDDGSMYYQEEWKAGKLIKGISHDEDNNTYSYTEETYQTLPTFVGGAEALEVYLKKNMRYPKKASRAGVAGKVVIKFTVEKDGKITHPYIVHSNSYLNEEAMRLLNAMPTWNPALLRGQKIKKSYTLPIDFRL